MQTDPTTATTPAPAHATASVAGATPLRGDGLRRFYRRRGPEPHLGRTRAMLRAHPDLRDLVGPDARSLLLCVLVPGVQLGIAAALASAPSVPWWAIVAVAYVV